jgi:hypothetical protein
MRLIPTAVHGVIDYLAGLILIASPWLFNFADGGAAMWVPVSAGIIMLVASAFTDYELGMVRQIPMSTHLMLDGILGLFLAASPWLFQFSEFVWVPHVVFGLSEFAGSLMPQTQPTHGSAGHALGMR